VTWDTIAPVLARDTKAVIVAHMFGQVTGIDVIAAECKRRKLALVEDAALALGARKGARFAGTFGVAGCFSFHPRKMLTTGEGGAVCTNDSKLAAKIRADRNYGAVQTAWARFQTGDGSPRGFSRLAFNCKLTDLQAAIGLVQLRRLPRFLSERRRIARRYAAELGSCEGLGLPAIPAEQEHVFQAYVCTWLPAPLAALLSNPKRLRRAQKALAAFKVSLSKRQVAISDAAQFLPELPVFQRLRVRRDCPNAYLASRLAFALPIYPGMARSAITQVVGAVKGALVAG
jgi:dTDP-4-amino-4,6-dideoxygalactose transaminase